MVLLQPVWGSYDTVEVPALNVPLTERAALPQPIRLTVLELALKVALADMVTWFSALTVVVPFMFTVIEVLPFPNVK